MSVKNYLLMSVYSCGQCDILERAEHAREKSCVLITPCCLLANGLRPVRPQAGEMMMCKVSESVHQIHLVLQASQENVSQDHFLT